jgi:hypothetical protein
MFHDLLELMFRHHPGHAYVKKEQYRLAVQNTGAFVKSSEWPTAMSPGSTILMSILVRFSVFSKAKNYLPAIKCPRCGTKMKTRQHGKPFSRWLVGHQIINYTQMLTIS